MTKQRKLVLKIIQDSERHLMAKEIFEKAKQIMPSITFATIYNSLNYLVNEGKILRVKIVGQPDYFDHNITRHHHMICDRCHKIKDVEIQDDYFAFLQNNLSIKITSYDLCLHYVCDECQERERKKQWN